MGRVVSGKRALAAKQEFEYEKSQVVVEMLNQFRTILETMTKDGKVTKLSLIKVLISLKKLPKEKTKAFFEDVKNMSSEEFSALMQELRNIVDDVERTVSEKDLISARIKSKKRILAKQQAMEPMFEKNAGKKVDTSRIFEKLVAKKEEQEILSM